MQLTRVYETINLTREKTKKEKETDDGEEIQKSPIGTLLNSGTYGFSVPDGGREVGCGTGCLRSGE